MESCSREANLAACNCTYPCSRKGYCCRCIAYHRERGELPACYFGPAAERGYDRSIDNYLKSASKKR